jgi:hypothetical protein
LREYAVPHDEWMIRRPHDRERPSVATKRTGDGTMRTRDWTRQHDVQVKQPLDATTRTRAEKTRQRLGTHRSD